MSIIQNLKLNRKPPIARKEFEHNTGVEYKKKSKNRGPLPDTRGRAV
jgi:hypothetical protein